MAERFTVLGIDPGTRNCGMALVEFEGEKLLKCSSWCLTRKKQDIASFLFQFVLRMQDMPADLIACESAHMAHFATAHARLSEVIGLVKAESARRGVPLMMLTPAEWRKGITGNHKANYGLVRLCLASQFGHVQNVDASRMTEHELAGVSIGVVAGRMELFRKRINEAMEPIRRNHQAGGT